MSVATSRSEAAKPPPEREAAPVVALRRPAVHGEAAIAVTAVDGQTRLADLHQRDPLSLRLPQPLRGDILEACLITTSGGVVGGDSLAITATAGVGARFRIYPQAAEKIYRSSGPDSHITVALEAGRGSWLEWLPQETILFEGARLRRRTQLDVDPGGQALAGEFLVFGRRASGETLASGLVHDAWRVRRAGRLVWADCLHMEGDLERPLASPACLDGVSAYASFIYVADEAEAQLSALRALLPQEGPNAGHALTAVKGMIVGRFLGEALAVRRNFGAFWAAARAELAGLPAALPRLWHL